MNNDPKYLNIPNICFSLTSKEDGKEEEFSKQRIERGFDDSETWCLTTTIAKFIIPRLERFQELANEALERDENEVEEIDSFLIALKLIERDKGIWLFNDDEKEQLKKGLELFPKIFINLWW